MKVLVTGAFGNLGTHTLERLLREGRHAVCAADLDTPRNRARHRQLSRLGAVEVRWTDVSDPVSIAAAVEGQEVVIHFAGVIPPYSENDPDLAQRVNVTGTRNLIAAAGAQPTPPRIVFASSFTIHGNRRDDPPPRHAGEEPRPTDHYTHSKVDCERQLRESGVPWTILRITAAVPVDLLEWDLGSSVGAMFDIPLGQRMEFVHPHDVATAFANAVDADCAGKILYVGGGESFQMLFGAYVEGIFDVLGLPPPPPEAFYTPRQSSEFWYTDYVDTAEGQALLAYQNHDFAEYLAETRRKFGWRRPFVKILAPLVMRYMLRYSKYWKKP